MWEWIVTLLRSEFVGGVVLGVVLTTIGAWLQVIYTARQERKAEKDLIKNLSIDTINNITAIVNDMADFRQKAGNVIHPLYLNLLDIEFGVFGRNREHNIRLPKPLRDDVRKFVNDCSILRGEIGGYVDFFWSQANKFQSLTEDQARSQTPSQQTQVPWNLAVKALDQLAARVKDSTDLVNRLEQV
jgi:hypothetical protein